jgi:hypothetical protein
MPDHPLQFDAFVSSDHRIDLKVPLPAGQRVRVLIVPEDDELRDLMRAAESSTDFWDNPLDDEDWSNA